MRTYAVVVPRAQRNYSADCPDLPGCVATGRTVDEALQRMRSAVRFHIAGLPARGLRIPPPKTRLTTLVRQRGLDQIFTVLRVAA